VLPGEIVRKCADAAAAGVMDIPELLGIQHLIVDEYQDLNMVDLQFVDQVAEAGILDLLRRKVGAMFMRVNSKCAHQVRPPLRADSDGPGVVLSCRQR
jgi:hypothetical protein